MSVVRFAAAFAASAALLAPWSAWAQQDKPLTAQQQRMKSCNAQASGKHMKGEERQDFMSHCLKGENGGKELTAQQEKMASCNREASAKNMKGDQRKSFMSECLRGGGRSAASGR
jgi:hypothetical protein